MALQCPFNSLRVDWKIMNVKYIVCFRLSNIYIFFDHLTIVSNTFKSGQLVFDYNKCKHIWNQSCFILMCNYTNHEQSLNFSRRSWIWAQLCYKVFLEHPYNTPAPICPFSAIVHAMRYRRSVVKVTPSPCWRIACSATTWPVLRSSR